MTRPHEALTALPPQRYADIRKIVRTGDLALCSGDQMFSKVIRWATKSDWSHCAMIVRVDALDRVMVLEAVQKIGVRCVPLSRFLNDFKTPDQPFPGKVVIARHDRVADASPAQFRQMSEFATDQLGLPFDAMELVKIGLRIAFARPHMRVPKLIQPGDEYFCAEYIDQCFQRLGIAIPWDGRGFIAPCDFAKAPEVRAVARVSRYPLRKGPMEDDE
ncbi:YiiX/YebB-like N1pC/P60 family cysteine hydrolase [Sphingomonas immobilis]|uniref:YiiX/YebB-like N1pC/P60 family cysteine hydrolase n=1 Tax=Sphingomonas immobilis TaxID=3063997 RepID=A0ABT8ZUC0_9SPHN|nr:YiiX/YebB-like N1pC/P60 family cysteine hydrolase [Sphingomonas sp. CA1-15]MDO7841163.1 YiiX/YebB-like N1pC/P60 family cysteine hydrolase [Sphingomonas sp. CA1-15]